MVDADSLDLADSAAEFGGEPQDAEGQEVRRPDLGFEARVVLFLFALCPAAREMPTISDAGLERIPVKLAPQCGGR